MHASPASPARPATALVANAELAPCPHCALEVNGEEMHSVRRAARLDPHPSLLWICSVCGAPRLALSLQAFEPEVFEALHAAWGHERRRRTWVVMFIPVAVFASFLVVLAVLLSSLAPFAAALFAACGVGAGLVALLFARKLWAATRGARDGIRLAWDHALRTAGVDLQSAALADALGIPEGAVARIRIALRAPTS